MKPFFLSMCLAVLVGLPAMGQAAPRSEKARVPVEGQATQKSENIDELLSRMEARAAQLQDYTVIGDGVKNGKPSHFKLWFKQPDLVRIDTHRGQVTVQPNGEIRGRVGHGLVGRVSRRVQRDDPRLKDADGKPFWDSSYAATVAQIRARIKAGAATLARTPEGLNLEIRTGQNVWRYVIDPETLFFRETRRWKDGQQVQVTRYSEFQPNTGLESSVFEF